MIELLQWQHAWGKHAEQLQGWEAEGRRMPPGYVSPPELSPIAAFYWDAFSLLSSARPIGMGVGPIPFPAVAQFAERYGISNIDDFETLREIVDKLDNEYLRLNQPDETTGSVMQRVKARAAAKFGEAEEE